MILVLTAFWKRPKISELYWLGIERLRKKFEIKTLAVVSDEQNKALAEVNSDYIIEYKNTPMGEKMNFAMKEALNYDFEFLMQLGSDNLISNRAIEKSISMNNDFSFWGLNKVYFYCIDKKECKEKQYGNIFGAGRCIDRQTLEKVLSKTDMYDPFKERGLDCNSERKMELYAGKSAVACEFDTPQVVDIKSKDNIWAYDYFDCPQRDVEELKGIMSKKEHEYMLTL